MSRFHTLKVKEIRTETDECKSIALDVPEELITDFQYKQGQYITFKQEINGEELRRSYSICSSPLDGELRVAVKQIEDGRFSTFANQVLQEGDVLEAMPPLGNFYTELNPDNQKSYIAFSAGSGITPVLSIIKTTLQTEPNSRFKLFYANRNVASIIFKEEIEGLKNIFLDRFEVYHFLTREMQDIPLFNGRFDDEKMEQLSNTLFSTEHTDEYFLCGPEEMILGIQDFLKSKEVDNKKIHFELFTSPGEKKVKSKKREEEKLSGKVSQITVIDSGSRYVFNLSRGTDNILDAAMKTGADLPFACKGGVCCTCKAKVLEGSVDMEVNYALEPEEVEQGYVLTCQAFPTSEKVVVDFDSAM